MRLLHILIVGFNLFHSIYSQDADSTDNGQLSIFTANHASMSANLQTNSSLNADPSHVTIYLYTELNSAKPDCQSKVNEIELFLNSSTYNRSNPLAIIIHGFQGSATQPTFQLIKDAYLQKDGWNVVMVDWEPLSKVGIYEKAVDNAYFVAESFSIWLSELILSGYVEPSDIHITGFSIGAHIAGLVGKNIDGKVAKIFALDPAFPIYEHKNSSQRLHMNDAEFVQVIHTCGSFISFENSLGHVDFYPNGGKFPQPSCVQPGAGGWAVQMVKMVVCSHTVVLKYFAETFSNETKYMGIKCKSWPEFQKGECSTNQIPMGYGTPMSARGNYYLNAS